MKKRLLSLALVLTMICSLFAAIPVSAASMFSDVNGHWAQATIEELASRGIVNGKGNGLYDPEGKVTRAEVSKLLMCTVETDFQNVTGELTDVKNGDWFNSYVYAALSRNLFSLNELTDNKFKPNEPADRETVAIWAVRLLGISGDETTTSFADNSSITDKQSIAIAYKNGIISGDGGTNKFRPKDPLTRAEVATIVKRVMNKYQEMHTLRPSKNIVDYNDEVISVGGDSEFNKLESFVESENKYVFSNVDDSIKNLQVGDVFIVESCDLIPGGVAIKVKNIDVSGNSATIFGDEDISLEEVVDEIDISQETAMTFENMDTIALADGVSVVNERGQTFAMAKAAQSENIYLADASNNLLAQSSAGTGESLSFKLDVNLAKGQTSYAKGDVKLSGSITLNYPRLHTDIDYGALKGLKKLEVKVITSESKNVQLKCSGSLGAKVGQYRVDNGTDWKNYLAAGGIGTVADEQKVVQHLASMDIPIGTTPFIATVGLYAQVSLTGEVTIGITQTVSHTAGFSYKDDSGLSFIYEKKNSVDASVDAEGKLEVGASFEVGISMLKVVTVSCDTGLGIGAKAKTKILQAGVSGSVGTSGIQVSVSGDTAFTGGGSATGKADLSGFSGSYEYHRCRLCLDGDIYLYARLTAKVTIGAGKLSFTPVSRTVTILDDKNAKIKDFYVSVHENNSPTLEFGWGDCPHLFKAPSVYEQPEDVKVSVGGNASIKTMGKNGAFSDDEWGTTYDYEKGLTYQWYKDGLELSGKTTNTLEINSAKSEDAGEYYCVIALEEYPDLKTETKKVKLTVDDSFNAGSDRRTGSVSETNRKSSFTYTAPSNGVYRFKNTTGSDVLICINGTYKVNEGEYELEGGKTYTVTVEWAIDDTNYSIEIEGIKRK